MSLNEKSPMFRPLDNASQTRSGGQARTRRGRRPGVLDAVYVSGWHERSLKGQCHEIFCFRLFHESSSPKPLEIKLGSFQNFSKLAEIFASQGTTPLSTIPATSLPLVSTTPVANLLPASIRAPAVNSKRP